jgi:hypothetical protein
MIRPMQNDGGPEGIVLHGVGYEQLKVSYRTTWIHLGVMLC